MKHEQSDEVSMGLTVGGNIMELIVFTCIVPIEHRSGVGLVHIAPYGVMKPS